MHILFNESKLQPSVRVVAALGYRNICSDAPVHSRSALLCLITKHLQYLIEGMDNGPCGQPLELSPAFEDRIVCH